MEIEILSEKNLLTCCTFVLDFRGTKSHWTCGLDAFDTYFERHPGTHANPFVNPNSGCLMSNEQGSKVKEIVIEQASGMDEMDKLGNYLQVTMSIYDSPKLYNDHGNELKPCTHQWRTQNEMGIIQ
ncbi:hypothetical protein PM082_021257 [Marasmius tenuissimus]|nr:hypothetical protein PM082_021257 [Marasmius tenuissimus]